MSDNGIGLCGYVIYVETDKIDPEDIPQFQEDLWDSFRNLISIEEGAGAAPNFILEFEKVDDTDPQDLVDRISRIRAKYLRK